MSATLLALPRVEMPPGSKTKPGEPRQFNVRFEGEAVLRIEHTAKGLGIDPTNLLRMIVTECLPHYEDRARRAKDKKPPAFLS